ncbi:MAG: cation diffusion facilitator family transporter [Chloroflexota bacterium]
MSPHGHDHGHPANGSASGPGHQRRLALVLALTGGYAVAEGVGGWLTGSLALLADAGHMLTDSLGLAMAVAAVWFAKRPATAAKTYGFYRAEILAALVNGLLLLGIAVGILREAWERLSESHSVDVGPMIAIAVGGLVVNVAGLRLLHATSGESLNSRAAYLEVFADLLGSVAVIVAGVVMLATGWLHVDAVVSAALALFIIPRTVGLLRSVVDVLLEAAPRGINLGDVENAMLAVPGVASVHDLHVWTITSGFVAMSGHVESRGRRSEDVLHDLRAMLTERFNIPHVTLQVESEEHANDGACCEIDPRCLVVGALAERHAGGH